MNAAVEKLCPIIFRTAEKGEVLVFEHPNAGIQLVKGTRQANEPLITGARRELLEECGLTQIEDFAFHSTASDIVEGQRWHFFTGHCAHAPNSWAFQTLDDQGHTFHFFWQATNAQRPVTMHPTYCKALDHVTSGNTP